MKKQLLVLLTAAAMLMTGCNSATETSEAEGSNSGNDSASASEGGGSQSTDESSSGSQSTGEGWSDDIKAEMMTYLGEVLPFVQLDENTLEHGYEDYYTSGLYYIEDESPTDLLTGYGALLEAAGFEKSTEEGYDYYDKGELTVSFGWCEATSEYPEGNSISVLCPAYQEPITEEILLQEGYEKVNGWPTALVAETIEGSGITLPSIKDNDEWYVASELGSNDYGIYNCAYLAVHSEVAEEYATKLAAIGITYDEDYEAYYDEYYEIEIDMVENNGFTLIDIYGPYLDDTPEAVPTDNSFVKISSLEELVDGDYAIVCEAEGVAFNGGLDDMDSTENILEINPSEGSFGSTTLLEAGMFTITKTNDGYTIKNQDDEYIYRNADSNGMNIGTSAVSLEITFETNGDVNIIGAGGARLRYNKTSGQYRFRFYKSNSYAGQQAIQLYKFVEAE